MNTKLPIKLPISEFLGVLKVYRFLEKERASGKSTKQVLQAAEATLKLNMDMTADKLAEILGLKERTEIEVVGPEEIAEDLRIIRFEGAMCTMEVRDDEETRGKVRAEFAAKWLTAIVDKFLDLELPESFPASKRAERMLHNAYLEAMFYLHGTEYLSAYLTSTKPCAANKERLLFVLAERLLAVAPKWDHYFDGQPCPERVDPRSLGDFAMWLLSSLIMGVLKDRKSSNNVLPPHIRDGLEPWLRKWRDRYNANSNNISAEFKNSAGTLYKLLEDDPSFRQVAVHVRKVMKSKWLTCAMPGCDRTSGLKTCSRCRIALYCSPQHQREHWKYPYITHEVHGHRNFCFETVLY